MNMSVQTITQLLVKSVITNPQATAHWVLCENGCWKPISFYDFYQQVLLVSSQLQSMGMSKNDVVAIMAATGRDWEVVHHAILMFGGVVVGIDPGEISEHIGEMVKVAKIKYLLIDQLEILNKFSEEIKRDFELIIGFGKQKIEYSVKNIAFLNFSEKCVVSVEPAYSDFVSGAEDVATIIFTSGTTGKPKGIAYRHQQVISAIGSIIESYPELNKKPCRLVCWLPLSNLFQRIVNLCAMASGAEVYFVEQPQRIVEYLPKINPHIFISVPRFYEKIYQGFESKLAQQSIPIVFFTKVCLSIGEGDGFWGDIFRRINARLFRKFTSLFGDDIRYMISGSAPMPLWLLRRFDAMGLLILEAYGMSENVIPISANTYIDYRFGTVGKAMKGNSLCLSEDNELLVKGSGVFSGYLDDDLIDVRLNAEGYLATGDYAVIDQEGFIRLTGRKSEVFKTSTGRKIAPLSIEVLLQNHAQIEHVVIFGESRKFLVALVMLGVKRFDNEDNVMSFGSGLAKELGQAVSGLPDYKRPAGLVLSFRSLTIENQELTANLKLRRKAIWQRYAPIIEELYAALENLDSQIHKDVIIKNSEILLCKL